MINGVNYVLHRLSYAIGLSLAILCIFSQQSMAAYQQITLVPGNTTQSVENQFNISVKYDVSDNNNDLSGIGFRIHYNSSKIEYKSFQNLAVQASSISDPLDKNEDSNYDHDNDTDKMIVLAWADMDMNKTTGWPSVALPLTLVDLTFEVKSDATDGETNVNVSYVSKDTNYSFQSNNASITIVTSQEVTQEIPLHAGWNLFSFSVNNVYHDSANPPTVEKLTNASFEKVDSLSDVLTTINGKYDIIRNSDINGSQTFDPNVPSFFNTLHYLAAGYGYWIKMKDVCDEEECKLTLSGARANPTDKLKLRDGWNLIGCWHTNAQYDSTSPPTVDLPSQVTFIQVENLKDAFSSIEGNYSIIRNYDENGASTFDPNVPSFFNTLHYIGPGYGYWIKMTVTEPIDFNY
jgi:hypothetical protein